jgi:hypothetical protein
MSNICRYILCTKPAQEGRIYCGDHPPDDSPTITKWEDNRGGSDWGIHDTGSAPGSAEPVPEPIDNDPFDRGGSSDDSGGGDLGGYR